MARRWYLNNILPNDTKQCIYLNLPLTITMVHKQRDCHVIPMGHHLTRRLVTLLAFRTTSLECVQCNVKMQSTECEQWTKKAYSDKCEAWSIKREVSFKGETWNVMNDLSELTLTSTTRSLSTSSLAWSCSHWSLIPSTLSMTIVGSCAVSCKWRTTSCPVSFVFASW